MLLRINRKENKTLTNLAYTESQIYQRDKPRITENGRDEKKKFGNRLWKQDKQLSEEDSEGSGGKRKTRMLISFGDTNR